jgi:hypothetical protein
MKKSIIAAAIACTSLGLAGTCTPASAQTGKITVGPSLLFGGGATIFGIDSKIQVADSVSVRPAIYFGNGATAFGSGVTYDFDLKSGSASKLTPYLGGFFRTAGSGGTAIGVTGGADFDISESFQIKGGLLIPISNGGGTTAFTLTGGFVF